MATEQLNKVIESEIGGSPICEAVKKMADVLFEARYVNKPDYENEIYTDELEGGDDLDSSMTTDADRLQATYGTPMSVVDEKDVVSMPKDEKIGDEGIDQETMTEYTTDASDDSVDDIIENLLPYSKTNKVSLEDREQLIAEVTKMICEYFKGKEWYDGSIEDYLNAYKCSYDDFITVKSYIDKHSMDDVYAKLLDVLKLRVFTVPVQINQTKYNMKARLYRPSEQSYVDPDSHSDESTLTLNIPAIYAPWIIHSGSGFNDVTNKQGITLKKVADCLNALYHNAKSDNGMRHTSIKIGNNFRLYSSDNTYDGDLNLVLNPDIHDIDNLIFGFMVPKLAQLIEPEEPDTEDDDDSMSPGNETPEDAYTDYEEVRERSDFESVGTKLPGDIYNPALIEAVDHISEALFEG